MTLGSDAFSDTLLATIDVIDLQTDKKGVFDALMNYGETFGFAYLTIGQMIHPSLQNIDYSELGVSNFPDTFQQKYIEGNYLLHDPVINRALVSQDPFAWSEVAEEASSRGKEVLEESKKYDLAVGVTIPIRMDDRSPGLVSFAGDPPDKLTDRDIEALQIASIHGYARLLELKDVTVRKGQVRLTPREVDVLHYVACGKTDFEIARQLEVSPYSVKDHVTNARRKLKAVNRAHCVMIAIRDGHIAL